MLFWRPRPSSPWPRRSGSDFGDPHPSARGSAGRCHRRATECPESQTKTAISATDFRLWLFNIAIYRYIYIYIAMQKGPEKRAVLWWFKSESWKFEHQLFILPCIWLGNVIWLGSPPTMATMAIVHKILDGQVLVPQVLFQQTGYKKERLKMRHSHNRAILNEICLKYDESVDRFAQKCEN